MKIEKTLAVFGGLLLGSIVLSVMFLPVDNIPLLNLFWTATDSPVVIIGSLLDVVVIITPLVVVILIVLAVVQKRF